MFNRLELLRATVASLEAQTLRDAEFILVDDRSDREVRDYLETLPKADSRFRVLSKPEHLPRGCQRSRNIGLHACNAELVMFLDSDDLLAPTCLENRRAALSMTDEVDVIVGSQAIFEDQTRLVTWVNVPRSSTPDLDRMLRLAGRIDVPWVNGGVLIRTHSLRSHGIEWRPEFHWDDVAFHFECLLAGMSSKWIVRNGVPDAYYRKHRGERYGNVLSTTEGIRNAATMMIWMRDRMNAAGQLTEVRRRKLAASFFHVCVLMPIDAGARRLADELITEASAAALITRGEAAGMRLYRAGRSLTRPSGRATHYWNLATQARVTPAAGDTDDATFGTVRLSAPEAILSLESLLHETSSSKALQSPLA